MTRDSGPTVQSQTVGGELMRFAAILEMLPIAKDEHEYIRRGMADDLRAIARWVDQTLTPEMVEQIHDDIYWEIHDDYTLSDEARAIAWRAIRQMADRLRQQMGGGQG